jgi:hypothetical protein
MASIQSKISCFDSAGDLSDNRHERNPVTGYPLLLTITKVGEERKDRSVAARQSAPLALVHRTSGFGRVAVPLDLAIFRSLGFGLADQSGDLCFDGFCSSLYSSAHFFEEFPDHCNIFINAHLFIGFSEPMG